MPNENEEIQDVTEPNEPHGSEGESTDWKAQARKWEQRSKANAKAAEELESAKAALSEALERAEKAEATISEREAAEKRDAAIKAASESSGVPVEVLQGYGGDDLEEYAKGIAKYFEKQSTNRPYIPTDGSHASTKPKLDGRRQLAKQMLEAYN